MEANVANPQTLTTKVVAPKTIIYHEGNTTLRQIHDYVNPIVASLIQEVQRRGFTTAGPMEFIYLNPTGDLDKEFTLQIAQPVLERKSVGPGFHIRETEAFQCVSHDYKGDVSQMHPAYEMLYQQIALNQLIPGTEVREVYKVWEHLTSVNNITEIQIGLA
ncbi:transcription activator, effector binding protein [Flammeovirgaceae bacterium 311]|nr:transcription activator, effector binding protein [Flammeovirgaceae bacterium 311]